MGYDYYDKGSKIARPVAPLNSDKTWEPYNLTTFVDYYANDIEMILYYRHLLSLF